MRARRAKMLDLAIVTSCHNYGRYLQDWAKSITTLRTKPQLVCVVDNGSTDQTPAQVDAARALLEEAGLEVRTLRIERTNFGAARNEAVRMAAGHEWVMHLDADDMLMAHALCDVAELAPAADVVSLGYERTGDLKAGPNFYRKVYSNHQGAQTLASKAPASGVSPFRMSFWERSPYREDMDGGWDTALWIGFAHLNARFRATKRPCFWYRQHADSVFNTRRKCCRKSAMVGHKLQSLRRRESGVSVLVPWQPDGGSRDQAWAWVLRRYELLHPEWEVVTGSCRGGQWRKGTAIQEALSRATGSVLVIADADCVIDPRALEQAVQLLETAPWVVPHTDVRRLDRRSTRTLIQEDPAGAELRGSLVRKAYQGFAGGGIVVVDRARYEATGGMPECFRGWGGEDQALGVILDTLLGPHHRLPFDLWHLWHPQARRTDFGTNRTLYRAYESARGNPDAIWHLLRNGADAVQAAGPGQLLMRASTTFQRGQETIQAGQTFTATRAEARRLAARHRRVARRVG
jgi:glycosyltransferase involved in cell wall biosynthesis